jgi:hypothetical protein
MSIVNEMLDEMAAKRLEKVLYEAIKAGDEVVVFIKQHIYPIYLEKISGTWGSVIVPNDLLEVYGDDKNDQ